MPLALPHRVAAPARGSAPFSVLCAHVLCLGCSVKRIELCSHAPREIPECLLKRQEKHLSVCTLANHSTTSGLSVRCPLLAPPCLLLDQLHLPVHLLDSRVQCPVLPCELIHLLLHLSHINHTHILDLTACISILRCARLCCHVGI